MKRSSLFQTRVLCKWCLCGELCELTSDVPITVEPSEMVSVGPREVYSHKIDRLSLDSGDEPSGHVSPKTSCLCGGMSLFHVRNDFTVVLRQLTINTRAEPDLDYG